MGWWVFAFDVCSAVPVSWMATVGAVRCVCCHECMHNLFPRSCHSSMCVLLHAATHSYWLRHIG
jgi:hypothetical protein